MLWSLNALCASGNLSWIRDCNQMSDLCLMFSQQRLRIPHQYMINQLPKCECFGQATMYFTFISLEVDFSIVMLEGYVCWALVMQQSCPSVLHLACRLVLWRSFRRANSLSLPFINSFQATSKLESFCVSLHKSSAVGG